MSLPTLKIIENLSTKRGQSVTVKGVAQAIGLEAQQLSELNRFLDMLVAARLLRYDQRKGAHYEVRRPLQLVEGTISVQASGAGFVTLDEDQSADGEDIHISSFHLENAMDGDSVVALVLSAAESRARTGRRRRAEGLIVAIKQRAHTTILGLCQRHPRSGAIACHALGQSCEFLVADPTEAATTDVTNFATLQDLDGKYVVLAIDRYPQTGLAGVGHVIKELGAAGQPQTDVLVAAYRQGLPTEFSREAVQQAQQLDHAVVATDFAERTDLRALPLVTIDGADARDFDDAVALETRDDGWKLWVAIADVSHYVQPGSAIDAAAYERGTSVYFPGTCLPMLPESLSNGICSLRPDEDRLAVAVEMNFDGVGQLVGMHVVPAVICSRARLTYEQVQECLSKGAGQGVDAALVPMLQQMAMVAQLLRTKRQRRGALDFDLPEAEIRLDATGAPTYIGRRERTDAHRLIEEFMLAANEAVAHWVEERSAATLYRVHEAPDLRALHSLQQFVAAFNLGFNIDEDGIEPQELQKLLHQIKNTEQEYIVNQILLRSMAQARYSADNIGHFGLASSSYCHFTSPIRRYPDLVQHRLVLKLLAGAKGYTHKALDALATHCTATERRAMLAERDVTDLRKCQFMLDKVGARFSGFITSVAEFGFFVVLNEFFVEGLVHIRSLSDDFYSYEADKHRLVGQGRRNIFQLGMAVNIEVEKVQTEQRQIDFVLTSMVENSGPKKKSFAAKKLLRRKGSGTRRGKVSRGQSRRHK
ncbi:MAG: ribonuclease R [Desulfuromonas sp.]|nr:ribonuclease R [Desulfuromonas sp.]